jgi:hypothetical protein
LNWTLEHCNPHIDTIKRNHEELQSSLEQKHAIVASWTTQSDQGCTALLHCISALYFCTTFLHCISALHCRAHHLRCGTPLAQHTIELLSTPPELQSTPPGLLSTPPELLSTLLSSSHTT